MPSGEAAIGEQRLNCSRQRQQTKSVRDRRTTLAHSGRHLLVSQSEVFDQLLVGGGFLQRRQVLTVKVLHQRPLDGAHVVGGVDDGRDHCQTCAAGSSPPSFTGDQLVRAFLPRPSNQHWLKHADLANRRRQFSERLLVEMNAWLMRIGHDAANRQLLQPRVFACHDRCCIGRNEGTEPLTESAEPGHR